jgi:putative endonuclease
MSERSAATARKGVAGESRAAAYLASGGWTILERNYRTRAGEIDIIAERDDEVAFVEVKSWGSLPPAELEHSIDARKQRRIAGTARVFLARQPRFSDRRLRFDVIFLGREGEEIRHIEHAFSGGID